MMSQYSGFGIRAHQGRFYVIQESAADIPKSDVLLSHG